MSKNFDNDDDLFTGKGFTPLRDDAFEKSPEEKIEIIQKHFHQIMETLGMDMTDDSLKDSPKRVAKMYVNEIFGGLLLYQSPLLKRQSIQHCILPKCRVCLNLTRN